MSTSQPSIRYRASLIGLFAGLAAGLLAGFNIDGATSGMLLGLSVVSAVMGALGGYFGVDVPAPHQEDAPPPATRRTDATRITSSTNITQTALTSRVSSANLRPVRITTYTAPMALPGLELRLMVSDFDAVVRTALSEGWYGRQTFDELVRRVQEEARAKAPVQGLTRFPMTRYRSLDSVDSRGHCEVGWNFVFEEGDHGLRCSVVVTPQDMVLSYIGVPMWHRPASDEVPEPGALLSALAVDAESSSELMLYVVLPGIALVWQRGGPAPVRTGPVLADVVAGSGVRLCNDSTLRAAGLAGAPQVEPDHEIDLSQAVPPTWVELVRPDEEAPLQEIPEQRARAIGAMVHAIYGALGCAMIERLFVTVEGVAERIALLEVVARMPTALVITTLYRLRSQARVPEVRERLDALLRRRRRFDQIQLEHPLDALDFARLRELCGYPSALVVSLRASFSPMPDLVEPLKRLGLEVVYANVLAGASEIPMNVRLQWAEDSSTQALLASTPLPMPCHVLHISGPAADVVREAVLASGLTYSLRQIQDDACSGKPNLVYRAALYLAALGEPCRKGAAPILEAFPRSEVDPQMRRAFIRALEFTPEPAAIELLATHREDSDEAIRETVAIVTSNLRAKGIGEGVLWGLDELAE